ncbi:hypothetical protein [Nonomuraea indica]|uniref:Uncharacterized protein n=1 Tax=Nonomuraea indica TaxID=1581193 RepID=A0ABW8A8V5_9ACTN
MSARTGLRASVWAWSSPGPPPSKTRRTVILPGPVLEEPEAAAVEKRDA